MTILHVTFKYQLLQFFFTLCPICLPKICFPSHPKYRQRMRFVLVLYFFLQERMYSTMSKCGFPLFEAGNKGLLNVGL